MADPGGEQVDLAGLREEYARGGLGEQDLESEPVAMFRRWFDDAQAAGLAEPQAMVVSTVDASGEPSSRTVLLKGLDERGFCFYTHLDSAKGTQLTRDPACALLFPWHPLERQVRVTGRASRLPREEVEAYFASRPRGSQLSAHASAQSRAVSSREELEREYERAEARYQGEPVPTPERWGGFVVAPETVEFWQGRVSRLHDRLVYRRDPADGSGWRVERLAP